MVARAARRGTSLFEILVVLTLLVILTSMSMLSRRRPAPPKEPLAQLLGGLRREAVRRGVRKTASIVTDSDAVMVTALPDGRVILLDLQTRADQ